MPKMPDDPHAGREAANYENPVASREFILSLIEEQERPLTMDAIADILEYKDEDEDALEGLRRRLIAMVRDGQLLQNRSGTYGLPAKMSLIKGRVSGHRDGFGFFIPEDGSDDLFLNARQMKQVFDGDIVLAREEGRGFKGKKEGVIVQVVERKTTHIVGRMHRDQGSAFVVPESIRITQDILVPEHALLGAKDGQYVSVEIKRQPELKSAPMGHVVEILGDHMAPGMEVEVALRSHNIPFQWPDDVLQTADALDKPLTEEDLAGRIDLRKVPLITIDGEDARDFDDAVYCERKKGGGWRLYVAIADVSHYVRPGTPLDKEAVNRGTSVYFPSRVVPMLPEVLSNGLCSLNPDVDRLCMVCEMTVSQQGRLSGYRFYEAVMRSQARLTYNKVAAYLETPESPAGEAVIERYSNILPGLNNLYELYQALSAARRARGAIDFQTTETRIVFNADRKIDTIVPVERNDAHKLIEECMLCANVATARFLEKYKIPTLFRVHEGPKAERLVNARSFFGELGLNLGGGLKPAPADYQAFLAEIGERPDFNVLQTVLLRSMSQAIYHPENHGHFGLGFEAYTHFTSPIRRYPDLLVHRAIRDAIRSGKPNQNVIRTEATAAVKDAERYQHDMASLLVLGEHCSMTERRADDATRDVMAWLKCEYLLDHVGEEFEGSISAVTAFGLFVELKDLYVEGLIHVSSLDSDYYKFEPAKQRLLGERTGSSFTLGDQLLVQVAQVNLDERKVDLVLKGRAKTGRKSSRNKSSGKTKAGETVVPAKTGSKRKEILAKWEQEYKSDPKAGAKAPGKGGRKRKPKSASSVEGGGDAAAKKGKSSGKTAAKPASPGRKRSRSGGRKSSGAAGAKASGGGDKG
ncbi:ribonuclease R [Allohahella marinimesophila]